MISFMGVECNYYLLPRPNIFRPTRDQLRQFIDQLRTDGWVPAEPAAGMAGTYLSTTEMVSIEDGLGQIPLSGVPSRDLRFSWSFPHWDKTQARFPFVVEPDPEQGFPSWYYDLEIHLVAAGYFAHDSSETVELIEDSRCDCGQELDWLEWQGREHGDLQRHRELYREFFPDYAPWGGKGFGLSPIRALSRLLDRCPSCGRPFDPSTRIARGRDPIAGAGLIIPGGITYHLAIMIGCGKSLPITLAPTNSMKPELLNLCQRHFGTKFAEVGAYDT